MNIRKTLCAIAAGGAALLSSAAEEPSEAEKGEVEESPVISAEFSLSFDSKYMTYGVVDGKDPIVTPGATVTFFDWVYGSVEAIYDVTKGNGKRGGYGNRAGKYTTLDAIVGVAHEFDLGEGLGTLGVDFNYIYEYIPTCRHTGDGCPDTQYLNLELSLGDLWLEPTLAIERDLMADDGTYVNLEIGHTFALVGDGEEPTLTFRPSVAQGLGNSLRTKGYFADSSDGFSHGGLMDTTIKGEFELALCENVTLGAYIAYSDYWLDSNMRDAARAYNAEWGKSSDRSWNVYGGLALTVSF
ncbi:MAG: hypothetical protein IJI73_06115 [Kiritimatiellae bacterium]|nr:hypothetical protein [Kiritimatiellia bacterium]